MMTGVNTDLWALDSSVESPPKLEATVLNSTWRFEPFWVQKK